MAEEKKVQILLSTYNGERYLEEQMGSLSRQTYPNICILIRDDGSKDRTLEILEKYKNRHGVKVLYGENKGVVESFFELIKNVDENCEFIAFCDQDDVWEKDKIARAVTLLSDIQEDTPAMYCSRLKIVDENKNFIKYSMMPQRGASFENSIVENIVTGCTIVINKAARLLLTKQMPKNVMMHDWWMYQAISGMGIIIFDDQSRILYRQHSNNVVGISTNIFSGMKKRMERLKKNKEKRMERGQEKELLRIFGDELSKEKSEILYSFIHRPEKFWARLQYALRIKVYRQKKMDNIIMKILIVINQF